MLGPTSLGLVVHREDRCLVVGPEAISFQEAAKRISAVTGKRIGFRRIPLLPLRIASIVAWPINPFLRHLLRMIELLNSFPQDVVAEVPENHRWLTSTFSYTPTTLEMEARSRFRSDRLLSRGESDV